MFALLSSAATLPPLSLGQGPAEWTTNHPSSTAQARSKTVTRKTSLPLSDTFNASARHTTSSLQSSSSSSSSLLDATPIVTLLDVSLSIQQPSSSSSSYMAFLFHPVLLTPSLIHLALGVRFWCLKFRDRRSRRKPKKTSNSKRKARKFQVELARRRAAA
ncbi:MAG: hypothetical protein Q9217_000807 [Psora testacea]